MSKHKHDFLDCGYDEQQCDNECQSNSHKCGTCGKSRSQIAKEDPAGVKQHVADSTKQIIAALRKIEKLPTLEAMVEALQQNSKELDWLSRERLVEIATWEERRK